MEWIKGRTDVAGILSPVVNSTRMFYNIPENQYYPMEATQEETDVLKVGRFVFSASAFERASSWLKQWTREPQWRFIVLDEIGPMELDKREGLWNVFQVMLNSTGNRTFIVVVRRALSCQVQNLLQEAGQSNVVVDSANFISTIQANG